MEKEELQKLFGEFLAKYDIKKQEAVWKRQSEAFRQFCAELYPVKVTQLFLWREKTYQLWVSCKSRNTQFSPSKPIILNSRSYVK